jgi:two-component system sensor histidine kinase YesM
MLIGVLITLVLSRSISNPIKKLAGVMKRIKNEESIDIYLQTRNKDEVGVLYHSFNIMMKRIGSLLDDVYESSRKQKNAELKALQAQINPHFVYNTLDSINWIALCRKEEEISSMIVSLAHIMRYSIKNADEMLALAEEFNFVKRYIHIQSIRYNDNFDIRYETEEELLKVPILKCIIQPLIENAILHGTEKSPRRGIIVLSLAAVDGNLQIKVSDNGAGADTGVLNEYLAAVHTSLADSDGLGIKNIHERLKMKFGNLYGLHYEPNPNDGITAIVTIPLERS